MAFINEIGQTIKIVWPLLVKANDKKTLDEYSSAVEPLDQLFVAIRMVCSTLRSLHTELC